MHSQVQAYLLPVFDCLPAEIVTHILASFVFGEKVNMRGTSMNYLVKFIKLFSVPFSSVIFFSAALLNAADTERLKKDIVPTYQSINMKLDARETAYGGNVNIALTVKNQTNSFIFHAEDMTIVDVVLMSKDEEIKSTYAKGENGRITLTSEEPLLPGDYTLGISFTASFNTQAVGLYRTEAGGEHYLFTQFEESDARKAFPCFDEPAFKFPYQITLTIPQENIAVSNTPVEIESSSDGWKTMTFKKTEPLPSYLLAIAVGPFETVEVPDMPVPTRILCVKGKSNLTSETARITPPLMKALVDYFERPYPYEKLDLIAVPEFWAGGMENAGAITFRETVILHDPQSISIGQRQSLVAVMAHELAHMWFGDLVTMEWWDDLWLNESFASWMGDKIAEQEFPKLGIGISTVETSLRAMVSDARPTAIAIRPPDSKTADLLSNIGAVYSKGQAVLLMMERWLGEATFRKGIINYINENEWKNATAAELWKALSQVSGKDVEHTLGKFVTQPGVPLVTAEVLENNKLRLTQKRFMNFGNTAPEELLWQVPVSLKYGDGTATKEFSILLSSAEETVTLPLDGQLQWIYPNISSAGYYRWKLPEEMFTNLVENSQKYLNTAERIGLLRNLSALLDAGEISGGAYLQTLSLFANDPEPIVIDNLISSIGKVKEALITDELKEEYAGYINQMLKPALDRYGLEARPDESEEVALLRPSLISWLADEGQNEKVRQYLTALAKKYLDDPTSVDPALAGLAIRAYAKNGDAALFENFKNRMETAQVPVVRSRFLYALGSFEDTAIMRLALDCCLNGKLSAQEAMVIPYSLASISEERDMFIFNWVMANYDVIKTRIPKTSLPGMAHWGGGCSLERLAKAREFFTHESRKQEETELILNRVSAQVNDCVNLREREGASVANYLKKFASTN